jgi:hypothetical protein
LDQSPAEAGGQTRSRAAAAPARGYPARTGNDLEGKRGAGFQPVGRSTEHAGRTAITLTGSHAHFGKARDALMRVSSMLKAWADSAAEQLKSTTV